MKNHERIFYYDFLRALGIFLVILCHIDGLIGYSFTNLKHAIPGLLTTIALIGVPLFLMLSGALLLNRNYSLSDFYKKRFKRIIYPFLFWIIVTIAIGVMFFGWNASYASDVFFGIVSPSWYVWAIIGIYLFIPVINSFVKEYGLKGIEVFLIIWAVTILFKIFKPELLGNVDLGNFAGYIGYIVLGYYLDNKKFRFTDRQMFYIGALIFAVSTVIRMFIFDYELNAFSEYYLLFTTLFQSAGAFLAVKYLDKKSVSTKGIYSKIKNSSAGKMIVSISVCSYGMYLSHYIIITFFEFNKIHSLKLLPVLLIVTIFVSWLATFILSRIPYVNELSGAK